MEGGNVQGSVERIHDEWAVISQPQSPWHSAVSQQAPAVLARHIVKVRGHAGMARQRQHFLFILFYFIFTVWILKVVQFSIQ